MNPVISIRNWSDIFENADSRKRQRLGFFYAPSGNDSRGYRLLMRQGKDGLAALGVFQALCQFAATMGKDDRGKFINSDGTGMEMADLWEITRIPPADFQEALAILEKVGWIEIDSQGVTENLPEACRQSADNLPPVCQSSPGFVQGQGQGQGKGQGQGEGQDEPDGSPVATAPSPTAFDQFWAAYPRKIGKGAAEKAFTKAKKKPPIAEIIEAVNRQRESKQWIESGGQFIPNPATWINQERWGDETEQSPTEKYTDGQW